MAVTTEDIAPPVFNINRESATAIRVLKVDWDDIDELMEELFNPNFFPNASTIPALYPGKFDLFVNSVNIGAMDPRTAGVRDSDGAPTPCGDARVTVNYATLPVNQGEGDQGGQSDLPNVEFSATGSQQIQPYGSASNWEWENAVDGKKNVAEDAVPEGFPVSVIDWTLKRTNVYNPAWTTINNLLGYVNSTTFMGYSAELVLYDSFSAQQGRGSFTGNVVLWNFTFNMRVRMIQTNSDGDEIVGWNHFLRDQGDGVSAWQRLKKKGVVGDDFDDVFGTANLNNLFLIG